MAFYSLLLVAALPLVALSQNAQNPPAKCGTRTECPVYTGSPIAQSGTGTYNELRTYGISRWAVTAAGGSNRRRAFRKLFNYINRGNVQNLKMDMTAPVLMGKSANPNLNTMQFFIGPVVSNMPQPSSPSVALVTWPTKQFYARAFFTESRRPADSEWAANLQALKNAIGDASLYDANLYYTAGFHSPWHRGQRRSEILIPKL